MLLNFNLISATCLKNYDGIFDKDSEFYWTWSLCADLNSSNSEVARGFSSGCSLDSGYDFNDSDKKYRELADPFFSLELPQLANEETKIISFELRCWESDFGTVDIKKFYSNQALAKLFEIYNNQITKKNEIENEFKEWLGSTDLETILGSIISNNVYVGGYITIAKAIFNTIQLAEKIVKSNGDELIGVYRADLILNKKNDKINYRWVWQDTTENWVDIGSSIFKQHIFEQDNRNNKISTSMKFSILEKEPNR